MLERKYRVRDKGYNMVLEEFKQSVVALKAKYVTTEENNSSKTLFCKSEETDSGSRLTNTGNNDTRCRGNLDILRRDLGPNCRT